MYLPVSAARCEPNSCSWRNVFWKTAMVNMPLCVAAPPSHSAFLTFVLFHFPSAETTFFCTPHPSVAAFLFTLAFFWWNCWSWTGWYSFLAFFKEPSKEWQWSNRWQFLVEFDDSCLIVFGCEHAVSRETVLWFAGIQVLSWDVQ